jgi:metal-responsive CopG/Arc/MetJ family transcriptional regulator
MNNEYEKISIKVPKELLKEFDEHSKSKGYQRRDIAILDLIKNKIKEIE